MLSLPLVALLPLVLGTIGNARPVELSSLASNAFSSNSSVPTEKRGLAWSSGDWVDMSMFGGGNVSWYYTWSPTSVLQADELDIAFVPQLWGQAQALLFKSLADGDFEGSTLTDERNILAFNEPDLEEQSNLTPKEAVDLWTEYLAPLKSRGYRLGAPVTTSAPDGLVWMQNFTAAISTQPDFYPLHYYDLTFEGFKAYVEKWHAAFNAPIWVTEFACQNFNGDDQCSASVISTFFDQSADFLAAASYVERWAPFGAFLDLTNVNPLNGLLSNDSGTIELSALGSQFMTGVPAGDFSAPEGVSSTSSVGDSGSGSGSSDGHATFAWSPMAAFALALLRLAAL